MRLVLVTAAALVSAVALLPAVQGPPARMPGSRLSTAVTCASSLGTGVKTRRTFCEVITGAGAADSISMTVPARTGPATLLFDLHNRFDLPVVAGFPGASYVRQEAVIRVVDQAGETIGRAAVVREFRTTADLFDQLTGRQPDQVKAVAPGPPEAIRVTVPAGITTVGIVGERLRVVTATGRDDVFDAPGRPVAVASNLRLEYRPR
jgi:hypothetical protein